MIGKTIEQSPELAQEVVRRGHEAAAHGRTWSPSYNLSREVEKRFIADAVETIHRITVQHAIGWNGVLAAELGSHSRYAAGTRLPLQHRRAESR
jgi:peptidoglycan/xylan/chitin deacetylase (PgdA/CDA1 family)